MKTTKLAIAIWGMITVLGCAPAPKSGKGFTLPEGNLENGKAVYVSLKCNACHKISGIEQDVAEGEESVTSVDLGGEVARIKTYGELVTAIINPSHRLASGYDDTSVTVDGQSKMKNYNDVMTVTQLTDLVAFLQSKYRLRAYEPTDYPIYYGP